MARGEIAGAVISECGLYRYRLWRRWGPGPQVLWIMLNPSTADAYTDDPTIRRCAGFTRAWGCDGFEVVNLFARRATNPRSLHRLADPYGPLNAHQLRISTADQWAHIVAAWGAAAAAMPIDLWGAEGNIRYLVDTIECLGTTKAGHPKHPLYLPKNTSLRPWSSHA